MPTRKRKTFDAHIHLYEVTQPGGVAWPSIHNYLLYRDMIPDDYKSRAKANGVVGGGLIEASPKLEDSLKLAAIVKRDPFFRFAVAALEIGAPDFQKTLEAVTAVREFVGVRVCFWKPALTLDATQMAHFQAIGARGFVLEIAVRGAEVTRTKILDLAMKFPIMPIAIDHLAGAHGEAPSPAWLADIKRLGEMKNVFLKFSSPFDLFDPRVNENEPWTSPEKLAPYQPTFDAALAAFGPDRLVWGSNWPIVEMGGGYVAALTLAEQFLKPLGTKVRDKVMHDNALKLYKRAATG